MRTELFRLGAGMFCPPSFGVLTVDMLFARRSESAGETDDSLMISRQGRLNLAHGDRLFAVPGRRWTVYSLPACVDTVLVSATAGPVARLTQNNLSQHGERAECSPGRSCCTPRRIICPHL